MRISAASCGFASVSEDAFSGAATDQSITEGGRPKQPVVKRRNQRTLRHPEPLEATRMGFAATAVIRRWFREMMAYVMAVPWQSRFTVDQSMVTPSKGAKVVVSPDASCTQLPECQRRVRTLVELLPGRDIPQWMGRCGDMGGMDPNVMRLGGGLSKSDECRCRR
jgi:hypothetical protein